MNYQVKRFIFWGFVVFLSNFLGILIFISSINTLIPSRDSGAFLYGGRSIVNGLAPYLDFWDHKTPLIYYINSFAILLTPNSLWGLWLLEIISLSTVAFGLFYLLRSNSILKNLFVFFGFMLLVFKAIEGGNRVEEFAMLFQIVFAILTIKGINSHKLNLQKYDLAIGLLSAMLFLLKPNLVAPAILYFGLLIYKRKFISLPYFVIGGLAPLILLALYLWLKGGIPEALDRVFIFNKYYSLAGTETIAQVLTHVLYLFWPLSLIYLILPFWIISKKKFGEPRLFVLFWMILELILSLVSRRVYNQYFLPLIVPIILGWLVWISDLEKSLNKSFGKYLLFLLLSIFVILSKNDLYSIVKIIDTRKPFDNRFNFKSYLYQNFDEHSDVLNLIYKDTSDKDKIVIWGSEPSLLFITNRQSVDRYYYQFRLFLPGYDNNEQRLSQHVKNIKSTSPKMIIDASSSTVDFKIAPQTQSPPLDKKLYDEWLLKTNYKYSSNIGELINFIENKYYLEELVYENKWRVYVKK